MYHIYTSKYLILLTPVDGGFDARVTENATGVDVFNTKTEQVFDGDGRYLLKQGADYFFISDERIHSFRLYFGDRFQSFDGSVVKGEKYSYDLVKGVTVAQAGDVRNLKIRLIR
jgi:hypothetical protein